MAQTEYTDDCVYCGKEFQTNQLNETTGGEGMCDKCMKAGEDEIVDPYEK